MQVIFSSSSTTGPGLASATGTSIDSAAKHTMACRVDEERMFLLANSKADLLRNKHKYNVNRHELVLNCCNPWLKEHKQKRPSAYPKIISNFGDIDDPTKTVIFNIYNALKDPSFVPVVEHYLRVEAKKMGKENMKRFASTIPFFRFQGFSLGVANAHHEVGDIVCAVQVGGMLTVQNGAFDIDTGQTVQWYFDFEEEAFNTSRGVHVANQNHTEVGSRKDALPVIHALAGARGVSDDHAGRRKQMAMRQFGMNENPHDNKRNIVLVKPYVPGVYEHYGDKIRIFGKCVSGGRAWDRIDVMMMTQSL